MKKVLIGIAIVLVGWALAVFVIPWGKSDPPRSAMGENVSYTVMPSNSISDALAQFEKAMNERDSAAFWHALTYESLPGGIVHPMSQTIWDSSAAYHVAIHELRNHMYRHTVHQPKDTAIFAQSIIEVVLTGRDTRSHQNRTDTMTAVLRVDNGHWLVGGLSVFSFNKPFVGAGDIY